MQGEWGAGPCKRLCCIARNASRFFTHPASPLKFVPDRREGVNTITRHDGESIWVGPVRFAGSVIVPWDGLVIAWPVRDWDSLSTEDVEALLVTQPELVIFGSGSRHRFARPALLRPLIERRIGFETMATAAACRTFNVLASEGRRVAAALLLDTPSTSL
jgi:uncharacterized protein